MMLFRLERDSIIAIIMSWQLARFQYDALAGTDAFLCALAIALRVQLRWWKVK